MPPLIFGSAQAFHARRQGKITHAEWQARRRAQFWSRGESPRGNQHAQIRENGNAFEISIATLPTVNGRLRYVTGKLWVPEKHRERLRKSLVKAYSVRVMRGDKSDGWDVHITVNEDVEGESVYQASRQSIVGGLDCNTDRLRVGYRTASQRHEGRAD